VGVLVEAAAFEAVFVVPVFRAKGEDEASVADSVGGDSSSTSSSMH
jgi:hypothetical protein